MALGDPYPGAGITNIMGQQGNPMGGVVESRSSNMFNPNETPEDAVIRLFQANAGIDQIAQLTGIPSPQVAQIINNYTGADTLANIQGFQPPSPTGVETQFEEEEFTQLPFGQIDTEQITTVDFTPTRPSLLDSAEGIGSQTLMAMDPSITGDSPILGEAQNLEQKIIKTGRDVYGMDNPDPDVIQTGNVLSLDVLDGLQEDNQGISDATKGQVLMNIGLNDVFTNADMPIADRIDFFKHYIAETMGLNYDDLKKAPDEGLPFLMAGAAMLQASQDGETRMAGLGKAAIAYGMTRSQLARVGDKEAAAYMMKAFDLGLEAHKMAKVGTGKTAATDWVNIGGVPYLMPKETIMQIGQLVPGMAKPWKESDEKREYYGVPKLMPNGLVGIEHRYLTVPEAEKAKKDLDGDLKDKGYDVKPLEGGATALNKQVLYKPEGSELFQPILQADWLALPAEERGTYKDPAQMVQVWDMERGTSGWANKLELDSTSNTFKEYTDENGLTQAKYIPHTTARSWEVGLDGTITFMEGPQGMVEGGMNQRTLARKIKDDVDFLRTLDTDTTKALKLLDRARGYARPGLFGKFGEVGGSLGDFIGSFNDFSKGWQETLPTNVKRSDYERLQDDFTAKYWNEIKGYGWVGKLMQTGISRGQIMGTMFSLALASAQLLNSQKGRDISNYDLQRFMQRVGANAGTVVGFTALLNDLEEDILDNFSNVFEKHKLYQIQVPDKEGGSTGHLEALGGVFAPGGPYEISNAALEDRRETLRKRKISLGQEFDLQFEDRPYKPPISYSQFRIKLRGDKSGNPNRLEVNKSSNKPMPWSRIASDIFYQAYDLNTDVDKRADIIEMIISDNFNEGDPAIDEFLTWYGTLIQP
jgi:hypothetical protein